jgi:hypothetical protein
MKIVDSQRNKTFICDLDGMQTLTFKYIPSILIRLLAQCQNLLQKAQDLTCTSYKLWSLMLLDNYPKLGTLGISWVFFACSIIFSFFC